MNIRAYRLLTASLQDEYRRLLEQHELLRREHQTLARMPRCGRETRFAHFDRLEKHRRELQRFRAELGMPFEIRIGFNQD
jgi:hypothetical protein